MPNWWWYGTELSSFGRLVRKDGWGLDWEEKQIGLGSKNFCQPSYQDWRYFWKEKTSLKFSLTGFLEIAKTNKTTKYTFLWFWRKGCSNESSLQWTFISPKWHEWKDKRWSLKMSKSWSSKFNFAPLQSLNMTKNHCAADGMLTIWTIVTTKYSKWKIKKV